MKFEDFMLGFLVGGIIEILLHGWLISNKLSALDVYQNKTTLEYKIVDSVVVDSIVVFKKL